MIICVGKAERKLPKVLGIDLDLSARTDDTILFLMEIFDVLIGWFTLYG